MTNGAEVTVETEAGAAKTVRAVQLRLPESLSTPGAPQATIGIELGTQIDFGRVKVTSRVTYTCNQEEAVINQAGYLAFLKAQEFLNDVLAIKGAEEKADA